MKRLLTLAAIFLCCMATTFAQFSGSGSGTESDPYLILNPIQLNQLRNFLNISGVYFKLMADIDLTEFLEDENPDQGWQPVGSSSSAAFKGIIDGNGKTISGLWINRGSTEYVGFCGYTTGAVIKNVTIIANNIVGKNSVAGISGHSDNSTISSVTFNGTIKGGSMVGGIVGGGGDKLTLSNCKATVTINASGDYVGGLIGKNDAGSYVNVSGCHVSNSKIFGNNYVGGACGGNVGDHSSSNSLSSCYIYADVTGKERVGGICGFSENFCLTVNLNKCGFVGNVNGTTRVGGLVGFINITGAHRNAQNSCFAIGSVTATGDYAGGLIGYDKGYSSSYYNNVSNSYYSGNVSGKNYTAGLVGYKKYGTVSNCYTTASVAGAKYVGGLVGYNESSTTIKTSIAINTRVTATEGEVGRVVGYNNGSIPEMGATDENRSYNRTIVISQGVAKDIVDNKQNGTGVSKTTLKLKATYVAMGWDFTNSWEIQETECYPYFKTQTAPPVIQSQVVSGATSVSGKCVDGGTITQEIDGVKQQMVSANHEFSFTVSPLQAGHEVRVSAKTDGKEQSYFTTEVVSFLGKGTEADPYQISTAADLTQVYRKGYYKLMNDIDLTSYINQHYGSEGWESIGRDGSETIYFDGNNHKVTGLWCNSTRNNTGLFSCFANGYIKNLTVETAANKQVKGGANTGVIIGKMINGTIENCVVSGSVADGTPVGGIVGLMDNGIVSRCQADVTINTTGSTSYIGGLVGDITAGQIDQCSTTGTLTATGTESYVGGVVGKNRSTITNCYSDANIRSSYNAAGIVAYNYSVVNKCHAFGNLYSNNYAAGIIGYNDGASAVVENCAAMNNKIDVVYESQQQQQGGGYGQRIIGGIKNNAPAPEMNNYALKTMQVSVNNVAQKVYDDIMNGTAKTEAELKTKSVYQTLGWDFDNVWKIDEGTGYPYLTDAPIVTPSDPTNPDPSGGDGPSSGNTLSISNVNGHVGDTFTLPVSLINEDEISAMQFELSLPDGVSLTSAALTDRKNDHTIGYKQAANGNYQFTVFSGSSKAFSGNEGVVANISLSISNSMAAGNYTIQLKNIELTTTSASGINPTDQSATLTVSNIKLGDVNGDDRITITDAVGIVNYILGSPSATFHAEVADVNGDNKISITDAVAVVNIILNQSSSVKEHRMLEMENEREPQ